MKKNKAPINAAINEIQIIHTWGLGDMILLTPVLGLVNKLYPQYKLSFLCFQKVSASPIKLAPYTQDIDFSNWRATSLITAIRKLRNKQLFAVFCSSGVTHWKAWLFMLLIPAKYKIGEYKRFRLPGLSLYHKIDDNESRTYNNYQIFGKILVLPEYSAVMQNRIGYNFYPQFFLHDDDKSWARSYLNEHALSDTKLLGIHPGCMAKNKYRRWPQQHFVDLIKLLKQHSGYEIVIFAGPDEQDVGENISAQTSTHLVSGQQLSHVAALISQCTLFINTDSGLGHVASCFGIKTLTIFGPGDERHTAAFSDDSFVIRNEIACAPCVQKPTLKCKGECLSQLRPEKVYEKIYSLFLEAHIPDSHL